MPRFERSGERKSKRDSRGSYSMRDKGGRRSFRDSNDSYSNRENRGRSSEGRFNRFNDRKEFGRESGSFGRNKRELEMTRVICSSCGVECEVPFRPTSSKPVYCRDCFSKQGKGSPNNMPSSSQNKISDRDLDIINEKLNKIMKALDIE